MPWMIAHRVVGSFKKQGLPTGEPTAGTDTHLAHDKRHISRLNVLAWKSYGSYRSICLSVCIKNKLGSYSDEINRGTERSTCQGGKV